MMKGAVVAAGVGAGLGLLGYGAFRFGGWLLDGCVGTYFRVADVRCRWRETRRASKESAA